MAEEESEVELDRLKEELESLLVASASDGHGHISKSYCAKFCKLVEDHTGRWQVPLPQLQVLRWALCSFVRGTASFPADCEHVRYTLSSLALSVFELLLFFGKDEFPEDPLKGILDSFQECQACLVRHQNVHLLQVRQIIRDGGPWASAVLQGILRGASQAPDEVSRFLSSEACVFLELRVRYLLVCERVQEAMALARACSQHPSAGRHLFFLQAYLTCLWKASLHDRLLSQMSVIDGKDAVEIICSCEGEESDDLLLTLSRGFLNQQLRTGDMFNLWDLVFVWSKLQLRTNPSTEDFLQQCHQMILTASNVRAIFPFIKIILAEVGKCGLRFCVELCAGALETDLQNDPVTKSLLYKTIAYLLPSDLEVCRVCALLVFFLERTVESYKTVSLLYTHPDQEYHVDASPISNNVRFEVLQILKKGLYFDPEFWNLITLRSNCVSLLSRPLQKSELTEIMAEEPWAPACCVREPCVCHLDLPAGESASPQPRFGSQQRRPEMTAPERPQAPRSQDTPYGAVAVVAKRRGRKPGMKLAENPSLRRSFRQLDMAQQHVARQLSTRQQRMLSRQAERRCWKRRGRKPRWLLEEEAAAQAENSAPGRGRRPGRKPGRKPQTPPGQMRTYERSPSERSGSKALKSARMRNLAAGSSVTEVEETLEISLPDNEVVDMWTPKVPSSPVHTFLPDRYTDRPGKNDVIPVVKAADSTTHRILQMFLESPSERLFQSQNPLGIVRQFHSYARTHEEQGVQLDTEPEVSEKREKPVEPQELTTVANSAQRSGEPQVVEIVEVEVATCTSDESVATSTSTPLDSAVQQSEKTFTEETRLTTQPSITTEDGLIVGKCECTLDHNNRHNVDVNRASTGGVAPVDNMVVGHSVPVSTADEYTSDLSAAEAPAVRPSEAKMENIPLTPLPEMHPRTPTKAEVSLSNTVQSVGPVSPPERHEVVSPATPISDLAPPQTPQSEVPASKMAPVDPSPSDPSPSNVLLVPQPQATLPETSPSEVSPLEDPQPEVPLLEPSQSPATLPEHTTSETALLETSLSPTHLSKIALSRNLLLSESPLSEPPLLKAGPQETPVLIYCCRLCHKVFKGGNIMRHANSHFRGNQQLSPGKCIFCENPPVDPDEAYEHFHQHVLQLQAEQLPVPGQAWENGTGTDHSQRPAPMPPSRPGRPGRPRRKKRRGWLTRKLPPGAEQATDTGATEGPTTSQSNSEHHPLRPNGKIRGRKRRGRPAREGEEGSASTDSKLQENMKVSADGEVPRKKAKRVRRHGFASTQSSTDQGGLAPHQDLVEQPVTAKPKKVRKAQKALKKVEGSVGKDGAGQEDAASTEKPRKTLNRIPGLVDELPMPDDLTPCPVLSCKTLLKGRGVAVLGHLLQQHPAETGAFGMVFQSAQGRCVYCARRFHTFQHFLDHVGRHNGSLRHPCPHLGCQEAFRRLNDMREHLKSHPTLRMVCCYAGCQHTSPTSIDLHRHERQHYSPSRHRYMGLMPPNGEVWVNQMPPLVDSELPLHNLTPTPAVLGSEPRTVAPDPLGALGAKTGWDTEGHLGVSAVKADCEEESHLGVSSKKAGCEEEGCLGVSGVKAGRDSEGRLGSLSSSTSQSESGLVNGHSGREATVAAGKSEASVYGRVSTKPFIRPLPCAYLDEKYTSMPKRRKEVAGSGSISSSSKPVVAAVEVASPSSAPQRQRCSRCFASLGSAEELQEHLSLKKCAGFGFDSDEEGGW